MPEETTAPLSVKVPLETKERLDADAAKNFRSTTSHLLYILDWYFSQSEMEAADFDQTPSKPAPKTRKQTA